MFKWKSLLRNLIVPLIVVLFALSYPYKAFSLAELGIKNNGWYGLFIDINDSIFKYFEANSQQFNPYQSEGCAFYASARVRQITGKGDTTYSGTRWWNEKAEEFGFDRGTDFNPTSKALACYENHVAVIEGIVPEGILISEGSHDYANKYDTYGQEGAEPYGGCIIRAVSLEYIEGSGFIGYVYLDEDLLISGPNPFEPQAPTVFADPSGLSVDLLWNNVWADSYYVWIYNVDTQSTAWGDNVGTDRGCHLVLSPGNYTAFITGIYSDGERKTGTVGFTLSEPQAPTVSACSGGRSVDLSWNDVEADSYYVWIVNADTGTGVWGDNIGADLGCHLVLSPGNYTAHITGVFSDNVMKTGTANFTLSEQQAPIVFASPSGLSVDLSWNDVGADSYYVWIYNNDTESTAWGNNVGTDLSCHLDLSSGNYTAYITGVFADSVVKTGTASFTLWEQQQAPTVSASPSGQSVDLSWDDVGADSYYVWIYNNDTSSTAWGNNIGTGLGCHLVLSPGNYTAYITGIFSGNVQKTGTASFTLWEYQQAPAVSAFASGLSVDLSWNDVEADSYYVWIYNDDTGSTAWGDNIGTDLGCHLVLSPGKYTAYITGIFPDSVMKTGSVSFTLSEEQAPAVAAELIGQDTFITWNDVAAPTYHLVLGSSDGSTVYFETDVGNERSYYLHLSANSTFRVSVTAQYADSNLKTGYVSFTTGTLKATVTGGRDSVHGISEPVTLSVNTDAYDSISVQIYRTPSGESTYLYWQGDVSSPDYQIVLNKEGYYTCFFTVRKNGMEFTSESVGWRMAEHIWSTPVYTWSDDNTEVTATRTCSHSPDHIETETVGAVCRIISPTETENGYVTCTSGKFSNASFTAQTKLINIIPALNKMSVLRLPSSLEMIDQNAFENIFCEAVIVPDGCKTIRNHAFWNCGNLKYVKIPAGTEIEPDAFDGCGNVIMDRSAE